MSVCFRIRSYIQHWQRNKIYGNNGLRKVLFYFFQTQKIHWSSYHSKCNFYYYEGENLDLIMKYAYIAFWSYIGAWFSFIHYSSSSYNNFKFLRSIFDFAYFFIFDFILNCSFYETGILKVYFHRIIEMIVKFFPKQILPCAYHIQILIY